MPQSAEVLSDVRSMSVQAFAEEVRSIRRAHLRPERLQRYRRLLKEASNEQLNAAARLISRRKPGGAMLQLYTELVAERATL